MNRTRPFGPSFAALIPDRCRGSSRSRTTYDIVVRGGLDPALLRVDIFHVFTRLRNCAYFVRTMSIALAVVILTGFVVYALLLAAIARLRASAHEMFRRSAGNDSNRPVVFITAHPDDESYFFAPTVLAVRHRPVHVFCISNGR